MTNYLVSLPVTIYTRGNRQSDKAWRKTKRSARISQNKLNKWRVRQNWVPLELEFWDR